MINAKAVTEMTELIAGLKINGSLEGGAASRSPFYPVANACSAGSCPTVFTDGTDLVVQGFDISADHVGVDVPAGEGLVRVPLALLVEAVRNLT
jgi:hypothetical protein